MTEQDIVRLLKGQKEYFNSGLTKSFESRLASLKTLKKAIEKNEDELYKALKKDLGKSRAEAFMCEIGLTLSEISWLIKHLRGLMRKRCVHTPLAQFAAISFRAPSPYGNVLIISPWNYPVLLTLEPLADAIAAGNTVVLKPSAYAPATSEVLKKMLEEYFKPEFIAVVTGGRIENQALLRQKFNKIFFTGSKEVGKEVMRQAAEHLTPVTLELGGKSPCIVEKSAKINLAAKRIVFGKFLNCGQTCVAPDYILCDESIKDRLVSAIKKEIVLQFGEKPLENPNYGKIINKKHFNRLKGLINQEKTVCGGTCDEEMERIEPTVMTDITWEDAVMGEEIFGPLLPVLTYKSLAEAVSVIESHPHPLALYCFTEDKRVKYEILKKCRFGGGCINDVVIHLATSEMPFGGVGESGMGCYHGRTGFEEFSHIRSIVDKKTWMDMPVRYQPYTRIKEKLLKMFLK
ncbi:MAG: aldehyde dehydrogenase [Catonella sp.]